MTHRTSGSPVSHLLPGRRRLLQAGSIGLLGAGLNDLSALPGRAADGRTVPTKSVIFVFLTGGISQQDSFDLKPDAPAEVRGEFQPIATRTPGIEICEHLPLLAGQSDKYTLVRSIGTNSNGHEQACHMLLTGRLDLPPNFSTAVVPSPNEWPSMPAQVTYATQGRNNLPPAIVLPEPSVNEVGRVRPGQYAGLLGAKYEAWHVNVAAKCTLGNGACPNCFRFDEDAFDHAAESIFDTPMLTLPEGGAGRFEGRLNLLDFVEDQQQRLEQSATLAEVDQHRQQAISVLADPTVREAFDVEQSDPVTIDRYGRNKFGLSLLMARRLSAAGVNFVQVNLGKNSSWDTHRRNFVNLKRNLLPYFDRSVSALLSDLSESGMLEDTLVIVTGEFGRTPKINKDAGRDHWGPVMTSLFAGGGVQGGRVIGATDEIGAYPIRDAQTTENLAATVYETLGIPRTAHWPDLDGRPHELYRANPIAGLV